MSILLKIATSKLLVRIIVNAAEILARRTNSTVDDDLVKAIKDGLDYD